MALSGEDQEHEKLSALYAGMADGELEALAAEGGGLTEAARQCLQAEITRRQLDIQIDVSVYDRNIPGSRELVTVAQFRDLPAALLAKGALESAGIESFLIDDNMVRMDWFISNLLGGIKLRVTPEDFQAASELFRESPPERFEIEGDGEYEQPRCPECQSVDISYEALNKPVSYTSAWLGVPIPFPRSRWLCHACGHKWQEENNG